MYAGASQISEPATHQKLTISPWNMEKLSPLKDGEARAGEGHLAMETRTGMILGFPRARAHRWPVLA